MSSQIEMIPIFSGSSGNCTLIKSQTTRILIDAGYSCKKISAALDSINEELSKIDAIFITHTHGDHIGAIDVIIRKYGIPVYGTLSVINNFIRQCSKPHDNKLDYVISDFEEVKIGDLVINSIETPHDSADVSVSYKISCGNNTCLIATDLGMVSQDMLDFTKGVDAAIVEANYDLDMLINGPYDYSLKKRVSGKYGHLSNEDCAKLIRHMMLNGTRNFYLGHLSENNNTPDIAFNTVKEYLKTFEDEIFSLCSIVVAKRNTPTNGVLINS